MGKKKAPAPAPAATVMEASAPVAFTSADAKKLAKLLKAADRGKRLDAIQVVADNHEYIATGGCLLPLLESTVAKKKMEDVVKAAGQVIVDYLIGRDGGDATASSINTLKAMEEAKRKPTKYKLAETMGNMVLNPDRGNSWNAVRSLRSMAATVASLPKDSPQQRSLGALLLGSGMPTECLCNFFIKHEKLGHNEDGTPILNTDTKDADIPWATIRIQVVDIVGVMIGINDSAVQTIVSSGAVPFLLRVLRWITASAIPDLPLLTSILVALFGVASAGSGTGTGTKSLELTALADGGAWGAVYGALKGPIMARTAELHSGTSATGGKKLDTPAVSPDLAACLDNMARCAEVLRVMAMTGAGLEEDGALEAGVAAMSSILGMQGLPREELAVANLMTGMVKAMGSIACLSETNRIKVCSAGAAPMVLALMAPPGPTATITPSNGTPSPPSDTTHGRLLRKTAEKCLHHLLVSRVTWMADDRALCDTPTTARVDAEEVSTAEDERKTAVPDRTKRKSSRGRDEQLGPVPGPAYLTVESVLAAANTDSVDVQCRVIRLLSRLVSSRRNAAALGAGIVPSLGRLLSWWLRTKDDPEAGRTPRTVEAAPPETKKSAASAGGGGGKKGAVATPVKEESETATDEALEAARVVAKQLEESDGTRVLRDEALAYTLQVLLQLAQTDQDVQAAIGADAVVDLLAKVLKSMPCTPDEFCSNGVSSSGTSETENAESTSTEVRACSTTDTLELTTTPPAQGTGAFGKPDTSLNLTSTGCERTRSPRHQLSWRGSKGRDPEVELFSPLDWGWDFEVNPSHEPTQPGMILRCAALRVLTTVVDAFGPGVEGSLEAPVASTTTGKGPAAAAVVSGSTIGGLTASAFDGVGSVLKHTLTVCLDLLSVDVRHEGAEGLNNVSDGFGCGEGPVVGSVREDCETMRAAVVTAETLSGVPVSPPEELVHEDIRLECLRLVATLLRLGRVAREELLTAADTHRNGWNQLLEKVTGHCTGPNTTEPPQAPGKGGTSGEKPECVAQVWKTPETFSSWDFQGGGEWGSLRTALPYVRAISALLPPLRNPDAPTTHVMAALIALRRLCKEGEHEDGGTQPEPSPDGETPLPRSREGTTGVLVDNLAGVAVGVGVLVPLVSIWGCAVAAAGEGTLPADTLGMVEECQGLIDYLIRRGHIRESFWASLPSLSNPNEDATSGTAAHSKSKTQNKSSKASTKKGKADSKDQHESLAAAQDEGGQEQSPPPKLGRPDPNLGPDRTSWGRLLNVRVDERRTQTSGTTALLMATVTGLETAVQSLLIAGADPNVRGSDGRTPLMCAFAQGMDEAVRGLVKAGADVDAVDLHGSTVLKSAFLCPSRRTMRNITRRRSHTAMTLTMPDEAASSVVSLGRGEYASVNNSTRRGSTSRTDHSIDSTGTGRPRSRSRSGSVGASRTRSRSGSLATGRRRSSFGRAVSFSEVGGVAANSTAASLSDRRRLSRTFSTSAVDSAREALQAAGRRGSAGPLKTPRGTTVVQGDARMVPFILACGADPNVSGGAGDFPLHWAIVGTQLSVPVMNQNIRIIAGSRAGNAAKSADTQTGNNVNNAIDPAASSTASEGGEHIISEKKIEVQPPVPIVMDDLSLLKVLVNAGSSLDACNPEGMTALHAAVIVDRTDLAEALLDAGASPNVSDFLGCLPLHYACLRANKGSAGLAKRLLALGMGRPLDKGVHRDLRKGRTRREKLRLDVGEIMRKGLREATRPSSITQHRATRSELLNFVSAQGLAPLHYVCDGRVAGGGREVAAAMLARSKQRLPIPAPLVLPSDRRSSRYGNEDGSINAACAVAPAASPDRADILRWLLSEPEIDARVRTHHGTTSLHLAAQMPGGLASQGGDLTRLLIKTAVNLDALDTPTTRTDGSSTETCRPRRASNHFPSPIRGDAKPDMEPGEVLFNRGLIIGNPLKGDCAGDSEFKFSALHYALRAGSWETAGLLLSAGASIRPAGAFPPSLHVACHAGAPTSLVAKLLDHDGMETCGCFGPASTAVKSSPYTTSPLFLAAASGSAALIALLLSRYKAAGHVCLGGTCQRDGCTSQTSDVWSMKHSPTDERNPIHAAAVAGHTEAIQALLDGGAGRAWLNAKDTSGRSALDLAVDWGNWGVAAVIASVEDFDIRLAIEGGSSCALLTAERANMSIVDEGSGEVSALEALRESNTLVMTLLQRLQRAAREHAAPAVDIATATETQTTAETAVSTPSAVENDAALKANVGNADGNVFSTLHVGFPSSNVSTAQEVAEGAGGGTLSNSMPPTQLLPKKIQHLHPCFAEGILYSNAKGVFIPETTRTNLSEKERAALIIQSSTRQAKARRDLAEQKKVRAARKRGSLGGKPAVANKPSDAVTMTDKEIAAVEIQSQARKTKAKGEVASRREIRRRRETGGEVSA